MRAFSAAVVFSIFAGLSSAQTIDPDSVDISIRQTWCITQQSSCPLLCLQYPDGSSDTASNDCDPETLQYSCVCENGLTPNASEYSQTIPYYECTEYNNQCVAACGTDNTCSNNCRTNHPCGAQSPTRVNITTTSSTMSATATKSGTATGVNSAQYTGFGGTAAATASSNKSGASSMVLEIGQAYGLGVVVAGLFCWLCLGFVK